MVASIAGKYDVVKYFIEKIPSLNWKNNVILDLFCLRKVKLLCMR